MSLWELSSFLGIPGIIVSTIITIIFFFLSKSRKNLEYEIISTPLITKEMVNIPGLEVTINKQAVEDLVTSTIIITNTGNQTVEFDDFAKSCPLNIVASGKILNFENGCRVLTNNMHMKPYPILKSENTITLDFEFLKPRMSFTIILLHSGSLTVLGELKSGNIVEKQTYSASRKEDKIILAISFVSGFLSYFTYNLFQGISLSYMLLNVVFWIESLIYGAQLLGMCLIVQSSYYIFKAIIRFALYEKNKRNQIN